MASTEMAVAAGIPFLSSVPVSAVLLVLGIVLFVVLCYRGMNTAAAALISAALVALGSTEGFTKTMTSTWISGVGEFISSNGLGFISAGLFSFLMRETKSGEAMAETLIKYTKADFTPYLIAIVAALLQLAGINTYIFIVATMAFALMKKANLPNYIGYAACVAVPPIITFTLPGVPAMPNVLPTTFLGTTTWAAPVLSLATSATGIILMIVYMQSLIKKARRNNEGYVEPQGEGLHFGTPSDDEEIPYPAFWKAILPIILTVALTSFFQLVVELDAMTSLVYGMWITSAVIVLMNWKVCVRKLTIKRILGDGCTEMFPFIFMAACVYGFGKVTAASACFQPLIDMFMNIQVNPYLTVWLSVCLIAGLCADGVGGMVMWLSIFGSQFGVGNTMGVNPAAVHRIAVSASTTFDSLPHSAMVAQGMAVFKTNLKESYKYHFMLTVVFPVIFSLVAVVGAIIFY